MPEKPHILFVSSWWPTHNKSNGTFVELHALGLASRGCRCAVLINAENSFGTFLKSGFRHKAILEYRKRPELSFIENSIAHKSLLRFAKDPQASRLKFIIEQTLIKVEKYIDQNGKPDFIFHHGVFNYTHLTKAIAQKFSLPIWYMENSPKIEPGQIPTANPFVTQKELIKFAQSADRRFAVTEAYVTKMESVFDVPFELCPNIITDDFFIDPNSRKNPKGYFQFVNVAILDERKNQQLIIHSFASNYAGNNRYRLKIAGDGKLFDDLQSLARKLKVQDQVHITGYLNRNDVVNLLDQSHCFVLSSKSETFGVVVIEAMARGIPAITSNIDGTKEIIRSENGILFEEGSGQDLSRAMKEMVDTYHKYNPEDIVNIVKENYGPDASYKVLFKDGAIA